MSQSKADRLDDFLRSRLHEAIVSVCYDRPDHANAIRAVASDIKSYAVGKIARDPYRMKELQDIMDWKRPPKEKNQ